MIGLGHARGIVAGAAGLCLLGSSTYLVAHSGADRPTLLDTSAARHRAPTHGTGGTSDDTSEESTDSSHGGGWEENRPTWTSPDNERPETPPGHDKPSTTTTTRKPHHPTTTSTTAHHNTTSTSTTTTTPSPTCWAPSPEVVANPSDYVPQCTVLDIYPKYGYIGPLSPRDPNMRPFDRPIADRGATRGYARTWLSTPDPGGYTVYAWEFPDADSARAAKTDAYKSFVNNYGAAPFAVRDGVAAAIIGGDSARAYWVQGRYLRIVDLSTQFNRDVDPTRAKADTKTIVDALIALQPSGCCS